MRMATFVPRLTPRLSSRLAKRLARRSKSFQLISRRYGASGEASSIRLASRQFVAASRSSLGLSSTRAMSPPQSRALRSNSSVMTISFVSFLYSNLLFLCTKKPSVSANGHRGRIDSRYHLWFTMTSRSRPHRVPTNPERCNGRPRLPYWRFGISAFSSLLGNVFGRPFSAALHRPAALWRALDTVLLFVVALALWAIV